MHFLKSRFADYRPVDAHGRLGVVRGRLTDISGMPVQLKGMSLFWSQWGAAFYSPKWISELVHTWKVDVVRLAIAVDSGGYLEYPDVELEKIQTVVETAVRLGIYVIVDWHSHFPYTIECQNFFRLMVKRYAHVPNIIYEVWNEPMPIFTWGPAIFDHHVAVTRTIRELGCKNLVICGTPNYCTSLSEVGLAPVPFENVCYAVHFYAGTHRSGLRSNVLDAVRRGLCIFVSEYGLGESDGDGQLDVQETRRWWRFLDEHGISYVNWSLTDKRESCAALEPSVRGPVWWGHRLSPSGRLVRANLRSSRIARAGRR